MTTYIAEFTRPDGSICFQGNRSFVESQAEAFLFSNATAAYWSGHAAIFGEPRAFWESERKSAALCLASHKGWKVRSLEVMP